MKTNIYILSMLSLIFMISCKDDDPVDPTDPVAVQGCTDSTATNYNANATEDDGSCTFDTGYFYQKPDLNLGPVTFEAVDGLVNGPTADADGVLDGDYEFTADNLEGDWGSFGATTNGEAPIVSYVDNPDTTGNDSATVLKIVKQAGSEGWSGIFFDFETALVFPAGKPSIKIDLWSPTVDIRPIIKLENSYSNQDTDNFKSSGDMPAVAKTTIAGGWETFIFNVPETVDFDVTRFVLLPSLSVVPTEDITYYLDNVDFSELGVAPVISAPTTAPVTPANRDSVVTSIFSDTYTDITGVELNANWGSNSGSEVVSIAENNVLKLAQLGFQGITFPITDLSAHTKLRVDYFAGASSKLEFYLINSAVATGAAGVEKVHVLDVTTAAKVGTWNKEIIDLSVFDTVDLTIVDQIKIVGDGDVYLDNIYFFGSNAAPTAGPTAPTYDAANVTSIYSDSYTETYTPGTNPNWGQATVTSEKDLGGNNVLEYKGLNYQGFDIGGDTDNIDVSGHTHFQFDYWTADAAKFQFFLIGSGEKGHEVVPLSTELSQWNTVKVPLSYFSENDAVDLTQVGQCKVDAQTTGDLPTIYFDNFIFITE